MIKRAKPYALKSFLKNRVKIKLGLEKDIRNFIQSLKEDTRACQEFVQQVVHNDRSYKNAVVCSNNTSNKLAAFAL